MKIIKLLLLLVCLTPTAAVLAQSTPIVEIVLNQPSAQQGEVVTADVYVRNAHNIGGADIGISVDNTCLKILERQPGEFLPTSSEIGGFSPFSELHDHDTRLAGAITDRAKLGNSDGIFFHVRLQVTCDQATASLNVSFAELSAYQDPAAAEVELISYTMDANTITTIGTQLMIAPNGSVTAVVPATPENNVTAVAPIVAETPIITNAPLTPDANATSIAPVVAPEKSQGQISMVAIIVLVALGMSALFVAFILVRRRPSQEDEI